MATPRKANPSKGGRPTTYKPEYCDQLVEHMSKGFSFMASCGLLGFSKVTGHNWAKQHPEFFNAITLGHSKRSAFLEARGLSAESGPAVTFAVAALKNCNPDEFRENQRHEVTGANGGPIQTVSLTNVSDEELAKLEAILNRVSGPASGSAEAGS